MPLLPIRDIKESKRIKDTLKNRFESERSGDQIFQKEQTKKYESLLDNQKETSKATQDKIVSAQEAIRSSTNNELVPLVEELKRRNDQVDMIVSQPFYQAQIEPPEQSERLKGENVFKLDKDFDDSDIENLNNMSFELPSKVFENKSNKEVQDYVVPIMEKINKKEHSLRSLKSSDKSKREGLRDMYTSQYKTLVKYKGRLTYASNLYNIVTSTPKKTGDGLHSSTKNKSKSIDVIICSNPADLYLELTKFCAAKEAGNTGVDNHINSCLDKLLKVKAIDQNDYNILNNKIFS